MSCGVLSDVIIYTMFPTQKWSDMSVEGMIQLLEMARGYRKDYPDLMLGFAVGLTALAPDDVERYVALLARYDDALDGCPAWMPKGVCETMRSRHNMMRDSLGDVLGHGLDPDDPETLSKAIEELKQFLIR